MKILNHGDIMLFSCPVCGCTFQEAVKKTSLANEGIWDAKKQAYGTRMKCPECDEDVVGFRLESYNKESQDVVHDVLCKSEESS